MASGIPGTSVRSCVTVPLPRAGVPPGDGLLGSGPRPQPSVGPQWAPWMGGTTHHGQIPSSSLSWAELGADEGLAPKSDAPWSGPRHRHMWSSHR